MSRFSDRPQYQSTAGPAAYGSTRRTGWDPGLFIAELSASRPLRVVLVVLAFIWWWPIGLATLLFLMWSKRMGCWTNRSDGLHRNAQSPSGPWPWNAWGRERTQGSGNRAFDEYRAETLRRLEEEQQDFVGFLDRLRFAKDKAEFDQFLAERRQRPESPSASKPEPRSSPPAD